MEIKLRNALLIAVTFTTGLSLGYVVGVLTVLT